MFPKSAISTVSDVKKTVRSPYAWPGGYPLFAITKDGAALCRHCLKSEFEMICHSTLHEMNDGWEIAGIDANYETDIHCDHCGDEIEKAYGDE